MEYRKKLKSRLYIAIIYTALGVLMIAGAFAAQTDNEFVSSLGLAFVVMGIARIRNYFLITRNEETLQKQQIAETDERNLLIVQHAKSAAFSIYLLLSGAAVMVLSLLERHTEAKWIGYSVLLLVLIYWICYWVCRKKY